MSLDSLQRTFDIDQYPTATRKQTEILLQSRTGNGNMAAEEAFGSREHGTARSLDALFGQERSGGRLLSVSGERATTVGHLPTATHGDEARWTLQQRAETFDNLAVAGRRQNRSPLVVEMAREIEQLKSQLATFQRNATGQDGKNGRNLVVTENNDLDVPSAPSPTIPVRNNVKRLQSSVQNASSFSTPLGKQPTSQIY